MAGEKEAAELIRGSRARINLAPRATEVEQRGLAALRQGVAAMTKALRDAGERATVSRSSPSKTEPSDILQKRTGSESATNVTATDDPLALIKAEHAGGGVYAHNQQPVRDLAKRITPPTAR